MWVVELEVHAVVPSVRIDSDRIDRGRIDIGRLVDRLRQLGRQRIADHDRHDLQLLRGPGRRERARPEPPLGLGQVWNANGGINGHPVKDILKDDANSATNALADVKSLIASHVVAIVGEESNFDSNWGPVAQKAGIPVIGGQPYDPPMFSNPDFFPTGGDIQALSYGLGADMKKVGQTKVSVMYCLELAACAENPKLFKTMFATLPSLKGMSVVYSTGIGPGQSSYIAPCLGAKSANSTAVFYNAGPDFLPNVLEACQQQGVKAGAYSAGAVTSPNLFASSAADGTILTEYNQSVFNTSTPGMQLFHTIVSKYASNIDSSAPAWNDSLVQVLAGLQMFKLAATQGKLTPTSASSALKAALWKIQGETLGGIAPPLTYVKNKPTVVSCWFTEQVKGAKEIQPYGAAAQCVPESEVPGLTKAFS